jgi:Tol biopolymer transport system component
MDLNNSGASFSPDGKRMVHAMTNDSGLSNGLFVTDLASGSVTPLPGTTSSDNNPLWSPDGNRIAFTRGLDSGILGNPGPHNIMIANVDGSNFRQITTGDGASRATAWMPDGVHLIYTVEHLASASVNMINVDTGETQALFETSFPYSSVKVSPDGSRLAFEDMLPGEKYGVFVSNLDGSNRTLIADGDPVIAVAPYWSPNGKWIIVSISTDLPANAPLPMLALIQVDTCKMIPLTSLGGYVSSWLP